MTGPPVSWADVASTADRRVVTSSHVPLRLAGIVPEVGRSPAKTGDPDDGSVSALPVVLGDRIRLRTTALGTTGLEAV